MAASSYDGALARLLAHEGGYVNDPRDPGGPTKYGITLAVYRASGHPGATAADVQAMTLAEAKAIYRRRYWDALRCDDLPAGIDYAVFDYGVNSGPARAAKALQRLVGVAADGRIGPVTLAAARRHDAAEIVQRLCEERLAFLKSLGTWPAFGAGWARRVAAVRVAALALAQPGGAAPARGGAAAAAATAAGGVAAVTAAMVAEAGPAAGVVVLLLVLAAAAAVIAWRRARQPADAPAAPPHGR